MKDRQRVVISKLGLSAPSSSTWSVQTPKSTGGHHTDSHLKYADIEALVLSGELFSGPSRSSSPTRSISPDHDPGWHDEELISEEQKYRERGLDYDSDTARRDIIKAQQNAQSESIGMGPGRTGVKGVIRDRDEAAEIRREKKAREVEEVRKKMEASSLGGKTFLEEERERAAKGEKVDGLVMSELENNSSILGHKRGGKFGHLREVGLKGFLGAVENDKSVWVVVHLYDPVNAISVPALSADLLFQSLERCYLVDDILARLARSFPDTKFLRAKASALGFATTKTSSKSRKFATPLESLREEDDEDDDDGFDEKDKYDDNEDLEEFDYDDVDLDMLPTMLVYQNGELVHNWVRVDWEAGKAGIAELLDK